jgi:hypothetical protein
MFVQDNIGMEKAIGLKFSKNEWKSEQAQRANPYK